jgi:hypothetical protein
MLDNVEGISLERSNDGTWHSASTIVRATPGYKNSRFIDDENNESTSDNNTQETDSNFIKLQSSTVHIYDLEMPEKVELLYRMHNDYRLSVKVYTLAGYPVYTILESELISGEGKLDWDGRGDDSGVLPVGLYVIVAEFYSSEGEYRMEKMPVAIVP